MCGVLGHLAPVQRCARSVRSFACAVSWVTWLLFTSVPARCVVLPVRCPGPLDFCSPVCPLGALLYVCGVLGHLVPVHRCARVLCCAASAVSLATWLLFTGAPARYVALLVRCAGSLGSCSPVCPLRVLYCVCSVLCHFAPVHRCARSVRCFECAVSLATRLLFIGVPRGLLRCVCGVQGHLAPVHRCARLELVRCPGPLGSCSPVCPLCVLCCACGVLGHLAPVIRCPRLVLSRCPGPVGSYSAVCPLCVLCCACGVLHHLAPVHRCARSVRCFAGAVSWATWLLFTDVPARCVVLCVRCPGLLGSCSRVCSLGVLCWVCVVLGHLAPVHRCAPSVRCAACAVSWATWLLFNGAPARCIALLVRCPGPLGSCSPVCPLGVLCCGLRVHCCVCGAHTHPSGRRLFVPGRGWVPSRCALLHPEGGCFVAGRGWVPTVRAHVHPDGGCSVADRGWVCCRARTRPSGRRLVLLGTCLRAVVRCVSCTLSRFAALGSRCCLAPVRVPWLWRAACLSGVPRGPGWCAAPHGVRLLSVLRSALPTP